MKVTDISADLLDSLVLEARRSARLRQHLNIHRSHAEACQRFLNALGRDSYIQPHRHLLEPKAETMIAVRGLFAQVTFDDDGRVLELIRFGTEKYAGVEPLSVGVDLPPGAWHTIVALVDGSVMLEIKAGPFNPDAAKEPAGWAPAEGTPESVRYHAELVARAMEPPSSQGAGLYP